MNKQTFGVEMAKTAAATRSELDDLTLAAYWEEFETWSESVFQGAMRVCRRELERFPTISQIINRRFNSATKTDVRPYNETDLAKCKECRDRGVFEIYHPKAYRPIKDGCFDPSKHLRTTLVACWCEIGVSHQRQREPGEKGRCKPLISFDANVMIRVNEVTTSKQADELVEFVTNSWNPRKRYEFTG